LLRLIVTVHAGLQVGGGEALGQNTFLSGEKVKGTVE
jgi:hypothetical protein